MNTRASLIAMAIFFAAAAPAAAGPLRSPHLGEATASELTERTSSTDDTRRVYCYNGVRGDQENLYRGWICVREENAPAR
ncbi:hypothetical protein [Methylocapsa acidiphila]|uniref:hypothetical protein n=1 Tax=Methylocapsa acidiphila TaxID=133552 RepID=UPI0004026380|nr:hypothetical protein [Methylocapsa acidiphila]